MEETREYAAVRDFTLHSFEEMRDWIQPWLGIAGLIVGVLGLGMALWPDSAEIAYSTKTVPIFTKDSPTSKIRVLTKDNTEIRGSVFASEITIANLGMLAVENENVRQPIEIFVDGIDQILDYGVLSHDEMRLTGLTLEKNERSSIRIKWKYFDPGAIFKIFVVYESEQSIEPKIRGYVYKTKISKAVNNNSVIEKVFLTILILALSIGFLMATLGHVRDLYYGYESGTAYIAKKLTIIVILLGITWGAFALTYLMLTAPVIPA